MSEFPLKDAPRWLTLFLIMTVFAAPFRAWQMLIVGVGISGLYALGTPYIAGLYGIEGLAFSGQQKVFMFAFPVICAGISGLLYRGRLEQYKARRHAEALREKVETQAERLQELEQAKDRFFANISHEFRTPLTLILGPVQDALSGTYGSLSDSFNRCLQVMLRNGRLLERLINQMLDLSKLEAGEMRLQARAHNLTAFLHRIVASFSSLAERKGITLEYYSCGFEEASPEDSPDCLLYFDADKLELAINNLLSNAFKFTPPAGKVRLSLRDYAGDQDSFVEITVKDTGVGIPPDAIPHVFDRFHQVEGAEQGGQKGTGIGLALVKAIVELHGGTISLESEPGFGSAFFMRLPKGTAHLSSEALEETAAHTHRDEEPYESWDRDETMIEAQEEEDVILPAPETPNILIVEDNRDVRDYLESHLRQYYQVIAAVNGVEGLAKAREFVPDLVISDVMMPEMDGYTLCRAIKTDERLSHIPVILLTAKAADADRVEGLQTGADDYIFKPFNAAALLARVENLIELRRLLRQRFSREVVLGPDAISVTSAESEFLEQVRIVVEEKLGNSNFGVEWLADEVGLSPRQLQRRLRKSTRLSAAGFIRMMRLQRAAQLLEQKAGSVSEIAYAVGFNDPNYFSRLFHQTFGVAPSQYFVAKT